MGFLHCDYCVVFFLFVFDIFGPGAAYIRGTPQASHMGRAEKVPFLHCSSSAAYTIPHLSASPGSALPAPSTACSASASTHYPTDCKALRVLSKKTPQSPRFHTLILFVYLVFLILPFFISFFTYDLFLIIFEVCILTLLSRLSSAVKCKLIMQKN